MAEAHARHRWQIPSDYNVAIDCLDRHVELRDRVALYYEDDEGHCETYTFGQMIAAANRFGNALRGIGIRRGDVVAVHLPQRPETAIAHMACYRIGAIALPIQEHVKHKLGAHEYPREVDFVDEFPQTVTGKIKRRDLREMEERRRAGKTEN